MHPEADVRVVDLFPEKDDGSDVADWLPGHTMDELWALVDASEVVKPSGPSAETSSNGTTGHLGVMTSEEFMSQVSAPQSYLVDGLLRESGIMLLSAHPKCGKSETARNLAKAVATGGEFLGRRCRQGSVLWIGLEEPEEHLRERLGVMGLLLPNIFIVTQKPQGDEAEWLRQVVTFYKPELVIIDTIGRLLNIEDINHYSQVSRATQVILDLRSEGTAFCAIHHNSKADSPLGSIQWEAFCDCIMLLTRNREGSRFVKTTQRYGTNMDSSLLERNEDTGLITVADSKAMVDKRAAENNILEYAVTLGKPAKREELALHSGRNIGIGRAAVDGLVIGGLLGVTGTGRRNDPRLYTPVVQSNQ
jgi:hypothetical protein